MFFLVRLFLYCLSLMLYRFHPLALALRLLFTTVLVGLVMSLFLRPYVGFMIVIVGVGGVLVAIRFALALVRYWDKVVDGIFMGGLKEGVKSLLMIVFLFLALGSQKFSSGFVNLDFIFFSSQWGIGVLFLGFILFLRVVVVVFIVKSFCGTLVDFKVK